jgi:hypothetical protein
MSQPLTNTNTTFPHFPSLPIELRLKIWRFAALSPRYLDLFSDLRTLRVRAVQRPALLSTCRESRNEVQFLLRYSKSTHHFFNPEFDVISVSAEAAFLDPVLPELERRFGGKIRTLAIRERGGSWYERNGTGLSSRSFWNVLPKLEGLREIQVNLAGRLGEIVGFKEVKGLKWESATQKIFERGFERIRLGLRESGVEWEMPEVKYGRFEHGELSPKVRQMLKDEGGEKWYRKDESCSS